MEATFSRINLAQLTTDANDAQTLQNLLTAYTWKRNGNGYRAKEHGSYSIYRKSDEWRFTAHNGDFKGGTPLNVAADIYGLDLKTADGLHRAAAMVCQAANLNFSKYCSDAPTEPPPSRQTPTPSVIQTTAFLPNAAHDKKVNFTSETAEKDSFTYKAAAKYYDRKTGVKQAQNVVFLQSITHIETGKKTVFNHKKIGIGYLSNGLAGNIKVKIIDTETGKKQMFTIQNTGNYVFEFDNLPTDNRKNITLILCGGEDDAKCLNAHLQPFGYYALTFGSESATIPNNFLTYLRSEFKGVFCLLDSDKTGVKMAIRNAVNNGLPYVSIGDYYPPSVKDICDIYKAFGVNSLLNLVKIQTTFKTAVKTDFERVGYHLHNVLNIKIDKYLSEKKPLETLKHFIATYPKILLQSPTDTGKTTAIIELSKDQSFYKSLGIDSIILALPRLFLCDQLKEKIEKETGVPPSVIDGKASNIDIQEAYHSKVILCTYDSLKKLEGHLNNCLLVIDETHLLTDDSEYRSEVTAKVFDLIPSAKRVLGLTATPNFEMCLGLQLNDKFIPNEIREALNFTLCKVTLKKEQTKRLQLKCYSKNRIHAVTTYAQNIVNKDEKAAVLLNDVKVLETVSDVINSRFTPQTATILSSKKAAYNKENPTYQAIVTGEDVPVENRIFLGTNILTAGVSMNFPIENLAIFGDLNSRTITQFSARPRLVGEVNKALNVDVFKHLPKSEFDAVLSDFEQKKIEKDHATTDRATALELLENDIQTAVGFCEAANQLPNKADKARRKSFDELGFVFFDENTNTFKPNLTTILANQSRRIENRLTLYGKLWLAKQYDDTFEIVTPQYIDFEKCTQAAEILDSKKQAAKDDKAAAIEVFTENKTACFELAYRETSDPELKENIKSETAIHRELSDAAKDIRKKYSSVIDYLPSVVNRHFDLKAAAVGVTEITEKKRFAMLRNVQKESDFKLLKNQIITLSELRSLENLTLTNVEKIRALNSKKIIEGVRNFEKSKRRSWITSSELIDIVSKATGRKVELLEAKMRLSELFEVSTNRTEIGEKKRTTYKIGQRLTLKNVVENAAKNDQKQAQICRI